MASLMILIIIIPVVVLIHFRVNTDLAEKSSQLLQLKSQLFAQKLLPVIQSADDKLATQLLDAFGQDNSLNKGAIFLKDSSSLAYYNLQPRTPIPELTLTRSFTKKKFRNQYSRAHFPTTRFRQTTKANWLFIFRV